MESAEDEPDCAQCPDCRRFTYRCQCDHCGLRVRRAITALLEAWLESKALEGGPAYMVARQGEKLALAAAGARKAVEGKS